MTTLNYIGKIPEYKFFEPKRTSSSDYELMVKEFSSKPWSFLEVSKQYILGDCIALYQILLKFFGTLNEEFPINPMKVLSAPSAAFKIWRTVQLPLLKNEENVSVYDFSNTEVDKLFRTSYCGGIVDVYRPHLLGSGYYYDVNSLYPTAMSRTMPVGLPKVLSPSDYTDTFFGFVEATVIGPDPLTNAGYVGLLPIKHQGKLICPGGTFRGLFFSEELRFALSHGYKIKTIHQLYAFQREINTFKELIEKLNDMKIEAQLNKQPTIRNIAKLLMNSMYGRFGMQMPLKLLFFLLVK
uniref:DNA-directed DNA polymerase n=1 Tax=Glomus sp. DAOM 240422 TaxID=1281822 RepID=S4UJC6_9GLOM|nr:truncated plasmid-related DNA polymerase [Glomus sp. DAOM 240422]